MKYCIVAAIGFLVLFIISLVVALIIWPPSEIKDKFFGESNKEDTGIEDNDTGSDQDEDNIVKKVLTIGEPSENDEVNGEIIITGTASSNFNSLTAQIYDTEDIKIGELTFDLDTSADTVDWNVVLYVSKSPATKEGKIIVYPYSEGKQSDYKKALDVKFESLIVPGRIKLYAPLENQIMTGDPVLFRGEMKDFFEALMSIRLLDEDGNVIYDAGITADAENYDAFAPFSDLIDYGSIPSDAGTFGTWELYEMSMEDESENVLLSFTVYFASE